MIEIANLTIGFIGGILAVIGTFLAVRQYRDGQPSIALVDQSGSGLLSPEAESEGYTWCFRLSFQNRRPIEYAITDIKWAPLSKSLAKKMAGHEEGWQNMIFKDVLIRPTGHSRMPLVFKPFEFHQIEGYWRNWWVGHSSSLKAEEYWKINPEEFRKFKNAMECLHNGKVIFFIQFADGKRKIYKK